MTTPAIPAGGWAVTGQSQQTKITDDGSVVEGVSVTFRTHSGAVGTVFLPNPQYTVANVRAAIAQSAARMNEVAALTSAAGEAG